MSGKRVLREEILADRLAMSIDDRISADQALVAAACRLVHGAARIAAYVPLPGEPAGIGLPAALAEAGPELLLPVLRPDRDLDWALYEAVTVEAVTVESVTVESGTAESATSLAAGAILTHLREPTGPRLGLAALATAELVFVPALAVDATGARLGRGGGSYDRALARVRPGVPVIALLYPDEIVPALPADPHDRPVTAVLTPAGLHSF